jgi:hypothetical protein
MITAKIQILINSKCESKNSILTELNHCFLKLRIAVKKTTSLARSCQGATLATIMHDKLAPKTKIRAKNAGSSLGKKESNWIRSAKPGPFHRA